VADASGRCVPHDRHIGTDHARHAVMKRIEKRWKARDEPWAGKPATGRMSGMSGTDRTPARLPILPAHPRPPAALPALPALCSVAFANHASAQPDIAADAASAGGLRRSACSGSSPASRF
jgi:hypothetical protein